MKLFLYDFDGTLIKEDSMFYFILFINTKKNFCFNLLKTIPSFILYFFQIINKDKLKENFLKAFFNKKTKKELEFYAKKFAKNIVNNIQPSVSDQLKSYPNSSIHCIVTASLDIWMEPISNLLNVELISTKSKFDMSDHFIGIDGNNCNNFEKVVRIKEKFDLDKFNQISSYGNSKGDIAMIDLADNKYWNYFFKDNAKN